MGQLTISELRDLARATRILNRLTSSQEEARQLRVRREKGERAFLAIAFQDNRYVTRQKVVGKNLTKEQAAQRFTQHLRDKKARWDFIEVTPVAD